MNTTKEILADPTHEHYKIVVAYMLGAPLYAQFKAEYKHNRWIQLVSSKSLWPVTQWSGNVIYSNTNEPTA